MPWFAILDASAQPGVAAALGINASGMQRAYDNCVIVFLSHLSMLRIYCRQCYKYASVSTSMIFFKWFLL
jgi:hypothetical protein